MEPDGDSPPIWSPPSTLFVPVRRRRRLSSILNPVTLTIAFSIILIFIIFLLLPPILSRNNQVLKPKPNSSVKKSWNSINIFLVLFAVLCGVFARRNDETSSSDGAETVPNVYEFANSGRRSVSGGDWLDIPDRKDYDYKMSNYNYKNTSVRRLRRSSSSYPDLRQESLWGSDGEKFKFFDDFEVDFQRLVRQSHQVEKEVVAETPVREILVDKFELKNFDPPPPTQPISQVPQPPPPPVKRRRSVHSIPKQYNVERGGHETEFDVKRSSIPPPSKTTPPPPPPPPGLKFHPLAERREKIQKKRSGTTNEIATAIVSLYQGTQKKKKAKTRDIFESVTLNSSPPILPAPSSISLSPPPQPPPPPSKLLQNFFKKSSKSKRVHSVSTTNPPPPPPPPPLPNSIFNTIFKTGSKSKRFQSTSASSQPPPPPPPPPPSSIFNSLFKNGTKSRRFKYTETQPPPPLPPTPGSRPKHSPANTGKPPKPTKKLTSHHESVVIAPASPLIPMPPPPPPFTMPEMKFIAKGDFVRIRSANSSRCSSPGVEDFDVMSVKSDGGDSIGPSFSCPSPDVDTKADAFILRRRDEWRLEKINSLKEQRNTGSSSARLRSYA